MTSILFGKKMNPKPNPTHLVQSAINFSEGRNPKVLQEIVHAMSGTPGAAVIDYSSDVDHNRSVVTVLGGAPQVVEAAFAGASKAVELIDLRAHLGQHPRIGAVDVIPFIPLGATKMDECVAASKTLAKRVAEELRVPVYLYEYSASAEDPKALPEIRRGGFEHLLEVGLTGTRKPDYGPQHLHPTAGACVIGAREPLIAFNMILNTDDLSIAKSIAVKIRERNGGPIGLRALGLMLESRGLAQVSMNITKPEKTPLHEVYELVRKEAETQGVSVLESELIGAMPLSAVLNAARHSLQLPGLKESQILDLWYSRLD